MKSFLASARAAPRVAGRALRAARFAGRSTIVVGVMLSAACQDRDLAGPPADPSVAKSLVTGAAAAALDDQGRFVLSRPESGPYVEISGPRALELASAFLNQYGHIGVGVYEDDRGAKINLKELRPCPRVVYALSAYEAAPPVASLFMRKMLGSHWLVSFCGRSGMPEVMIAVSAHNTDVTVENGRLVEPGQMGANFRSMGVPVGVQLPPSPETAVLLAATSTGKRVSEVPVYTMPLRPKAPWLGVWTLGLEAPARVRGVSSDISRTTASLAVGFANSWNPAVLDADPRVAGTRVATFDEMDRTTTTGGFTFQLAYRVGVPAQYEEVREEGR